MFSRHRRGRSVGGFTLVELLVVVAIIALLIAILLPALARAREVTRRTVCGSNLKQIGNVSHTFANEYNGFFPAGLRAVGSNAIAWPMLWRGEVPSDMNDNRWYAGMGAGWPSNDLKSAWKLSGTPWSAWLDAGLGDSADSVQITICPSATRMPWVGVRDTSFRRFDNHSYWGSAYSTTYPLYTGIHKTGTWATNARGEIMPAWKISDHHPSQRIIASDAVWWEPAPAAWASDAPSHREVINHPDPQDLSQPAYQNRIFADGHVGPETDWPGTLRGSSLWGQENYDNDGQHPFWWESPDS